MKLVITLVVLSFAAALAACGGTTERTGNAVNTGSNNAPANSGQVASVNGDPSAPNPTDTVAPPGENFNTNTRRKVVDVPSSGPPPPPQFRPAGEDSEIAVTMTPDGRVQEIRHFKRHPQFAKIESLWGGQGPKELKFYLRSGKVIEKSSDRIANLQTASTGVLMEIAGVQPPPPPTGSSRTDKKQPL